jgi:predicted small lipoprotein YifL
MRLLLISAAMALAAAACGQRGPLYLRDSPPPGMKPPQQRDTYKPVPYPESLKDPQQEERQAK